MTCLELSLVLAVVMAADLAPVQRTATDLVWQAVVESGAAPRDATIEDAVWRDEDGPAGAELRTVLLSGDYAVYVAGDTKSAWIAVSVVDRGTGQQLSAFRGRASRGMSNILRLERACICMVTLTPPAAIIRGGTKSYEMAVAFLRKNPRR